MLHYFVTAAFCVLSYARMNTCTCACSHIHTPGEPSFEHLGNSSDIAKKNSVDVITIRRYTSCLMLHACTYIPMHAHTLRDPKLLTPRNLCILLVVAGICWSVNQTWELSSAGNDNKPHIHQVLTSTYAHLHWTRWLSVNTRAHVFMTPKLPLTDGGANVCLKAQNIADCCSRLSAVLSRGMPSDPTPVEPGPRLCFMKFFPQRQAGPRTWCLARTCANNYSCLSGGGEYFWAVRRCRSVNNMGFWDLGSLTGGLRLTGTEGCGWVVGGSLGSWWSLVFLAIADPAEHGLWTD